MTDFENIQLEYRKDVKYISNAEIEKYLLKEQIDEHSRRFKELKDAFEKRSIGRKSFYNWRLQSQTDSPAIQAKPEASANKQRHGAGSKGEVDFEGSLLKMKKIMQVRQYSRLTVKAYIVALRGFFEWYRQNSAHSFIEVSRQQVLDFLHQKIEVEKYSVTLARHLKSSLLIYFNEVHSMSRDFSYIAGFRSKKKLPDIPNRNQVRRLLSATKNVKHKVLMGFLYGSGMRVSEVVKIRVRDLETDELMLKIRQGKGKQDRFSIISENIAEDLTILLDGKKQQDFLFESATRQGHPLSVRTAQQVLKQALRRCGISDKYTCHSLRHAFATHLLENGTGLRFIQKLLGHKNISTTTIYTRIAKTELARIKSPL